MSEIQFFPISRSKPRLAVGHPTISHHDCFSGGGIVIILTRVDELDFVGATTPYYFDRLFGNNK